jgi:methyl-accepting chemotaxis protein
MNDVQTKLVYRRKNVYIDKDFQTKFILKFCGLVAIGAGLTIIALYVLSLQSTSVSFVNARVKVMTTADFILPLLIQTVFIVTGAVSVGAAAVTMIVSHKIAGPLFRFKQTFRELAAGNFTNEVRLRQGDQLTDVAGDFNQMITVLRARLTETRQALAGLKADIALIGELNGKDVQKKSPDLDSKVQVLEKSLEFFRI